MIKSAYMRLMHAGANVCACQLSGMAHRYGEAEAVFTLCRMLQQNAVPHPRILLLHACSVSSQQPVDIDDVVAPSRRKLLAMLSGAAALVPGSQLLVAGQCRAAADEELSAGGTLAQPSTIEALPPAEQQLPVANSSTAPPPPAAANTGTFSEKTTTVRCAVLHAAGVGDQLHCTALHCTLGSMCGQLIQMRHALQASALWSLPSLAHRQKHRQVCFACNTVNNAVTLLASPHAYRRAQCA